MTWKELEAKFEAFGDKINLRKKFPNYFNIWIFRSYYLFVVLVVVAAFFLSGAETEGYYVHCPEDAMGGRCTNPLYVCTNTIADNNVDCIPECPSNVPSELCLKEVLELGETYGSKNPYIGLGIWIILIGLIATVLFNHTMWKNK